MAISLINIQLKMWLTNEMLPALVKWIINTKMGIILGVRNSEVHTNS